MRLRSCRGDSGTLNSGTMNVNRSYHLSDNSRDTARVGPECRCVSLTAGLKYEDYKDVTRCNVLLLTLFLFDKNVFGDLSFFDLSFELTKNIISNVRIILLLFIHLKLLTLLSYVI